MPETPEQKARREIDADLTAAGWLVQDRAALDLTAGRGIAVREFPMKSGFGFADYLLYLDGLPDKLPAHTRPLPFLFESNGAVTYFTNGLDPAPRSRQVFNFFRPETLAEWIAQPEQLAQEGVTPFLKAAFRRRILEIRQQNEQTIDRHTLDEVLYAGFDASAVEKAQAKVKDFRNWIAEHKDELTALQVLYAGTRPLKLSLKDLRQLKDALARPPLAATPVQLWRAFEAVEADKVKGSGGQQLADLVNLVRHALIPTFTLVPYRDELWERYQAWFKERDADNTFTTEQREWLGRMAEHIAASLSLEPEDFETGWFGQHGSLGKAHALFGDRLRPLMGELNGRLAA